MIMKLTRRNFLSASATAVAVSAFNIVPSKVLGQNAPSNRINMAMVGVGGMGSGNMRAFLGLDDVHVKVVCDVNTSKME
jgi:Spy/CpxP family protein refolding chaperone